MFRSVFLYGLTVLYGTTLAAQQPDTVTDSVFLALTENGWPGQTRAFAEWRLASPSLRLQAPRCRGTASAVTRDSIGPVRPGMTLGDLSRVCPRVLHVWGLGGSGPEDRYYPIIAVTLGQGIVFASVEDTAPGARLFTVFTKDTAVRTREGIGVGSTYAQLEATYRAATLSAGAEECGAAEAKVDALPGVYFEFPWRSCEDPTEEESRGLRVSQIIVPQPTPAEIASRQPKGPQWVPDSGFAAATSVTWPRPSLAYSVERVPRSLVPSCTSSTPLLTPDSIGPVAIRETLSELRQRCPRMLYVWHLSHQGQPAVFVRLGEVVVWALLIDTMPASRVHLIATVDSAARTAEGIGVGLEVNELFARHKDLILMAGPEPALEYCDMSFDSLRGLSFSIPIKDCERRNKREGRYPLSELLPAGTHIDTVRVRGSR